MKINIALGVSRDWFTYACVTATSILVNSRKEDDYCFYILSNGFEELEKEQFLKLKNLSNIEIKFIELDDKLFEGAVHDWLGVSASYRLRLQKFCKEDKILYLDSDIVACQDVSDFYKTDISNYYVAAVEDKCSNGMRSRISKINEGETFFNSGVQLINLKQFRENNIEEQFFEVLRLKGYYTDQDVLNDVCYGKILSMPLKYNIVPADDYKDRKEEAELAKNNPVLYHYYSKPWQGNSTMEQYREWYKYKDIYDNL